MLACAQNLETFSITGPLGHKPSFNGRDKNIEQLFQRFNALKHLKNLTFVQFFIVNVPYDSLKLNPGFTSLAILHDSVITDGELEIIFRNNPQITTLALNGCTKITESIAKQIGQTILPKLSSATFGFHVQKGKSQFGMSFMNGVEPIKSNVLTTLNLRGVTFKEKNFKAISKIGQTCPNLIGLHFDCFGENLAIPEVPLDVFKKGFTRLSQLSFKMQATESRSSVKSFFSRFMKQFCEVRITNVSFEDLQEILKFPELEYAQLGTRKTETSKRPETPPRPEKVRPGDRGSTRLSMDSDNLHSSRGTNNIKLLKIGALQLTDFCFASINALC